MNEMGKRIKKLLLERNMSQKTLAEKTGCTEAAISLYIKGDRIPRSSVLVKIAEALNTTTDYLLDGTPIANEEIGYAKKLIARNANQMSQEEKLEIIKILLGGDE